MAWDCSAIEPAEPHFISSAASQNAKFSPVVRGKKKVKSVLFMYHISYQGSSMYNQQKVDQSKSHQSN